MRFLNRTEVTASKRSNEKIAHRTKAKSRRKENSRREGDVIKIKSYWDVNIVALKIVIDFFAADQESKMRTEKERAKKKWGQTIKTTANERCVERETREKEEN